MKKVGDSFQSGFDQSKNSIELESQTVDSKFDGLSVRDQRSATQTVNFAELDRIEAYDPLFDSQSVQPLLHQT